MFLLRKLKKWIELEIAELGELEKDWKRKKGCEYNVWACKQQRLALDGVLYIIENKNIWATCRGHGIFKQK